MTKDLMRSVCGRYPRSDGHIRSVRATDHRTSLGDAGAGTDAGHPAEVKAGERQLADVPPHL